ncbi:MAG: TIGR02328 family protein [Bacillota bacterium]
MRLWHEDLIDKLPRQQLLGQHRECCALRGKGWNKKHSTVNYVFKYNPIKLFSYHSKVMLEMEDRGYNINQKWWNMNYRGKQLMYDPDFVDRNVLHMISGKIYKEHDKKYLDECVNNLLQKGVVCKYLEEVI